MQVSKWGNSLAIRLPSSVVQVLNLKPGDEVEIVVAHERGLEIRHDQEREAVLERLRALRRPMPKGFRFDRYEANER